MGGYINPELSHKKPWVKWTLIISAVVALVAIVVAGVAFAAWNNSSQKALLDAVNYAAQNPGEYQYTSQKFNATVTLGNKIYEADITLGATDVNVIVADQTIYLKSSDPMAALSELSGVSVSTLSSPVLKPIFASIQNQWVSMDLQAPPFQSDIINNIHCVTDTKDSVTNDTGMRVQIGAAYFSHPFINILSKSTTGSTISYGLSVNATNLNLFQTAFENTSFYKSLASCTQLPQISLGDSSLATAKATVILSQANHELKSITVGDGSSSVRITANYSNVPTLSVPVNVVGFNQLANNIYQSYMSR